MKWPNDAADWPMRELSQHVLSRPHRWHIQRAGKGPTLILIHGAGGATQSWRNLFPLLVERFDVVAIDLPGQGFTQSGSQSRHGLEHMAEDLRSLLHKLDMRPHALIGHSAGAAIALQMAQMGCGVRQIFGINAALNNFEGVAGWLFPLLAKALAMTPFAANVFAATSSRSSVQNLLNGTGSHIGKEGEDLYLRLAKDAGHVDGTLSMMAQWSLERLIKNKAQKIETHLLVGTNDKAVPPQTSHDYAAATQNATVTEISGLGHLAHEEDAAQVFEWIVRHLK